MERSHLPTGLSMAAWLAISACICSHGVSAVQASDVSDDVMTEENLAQLQHLLVKYSKYKHELRAAEGIEDHLLDKRHGKKRGHKKAQKKHQEITVNDGQKRKKRSKKMPVVTESPKQQKDVAASCACCDSSDNEESMYNYVVNSLYSWYYGEDTTKTDEKQEENVVDDVDDVSDADEPHLAQIASYIAKHGHKFGHDEKNLRQKDIKKLLELVHAKDHHDQDGHHHARHSRFSSSQKGVIVGVITAIIVLIVAGVCYYIYNEYGLPTRFFKRRLTVTRRAAERDLPLKATGPNVSHIYPSP